jgi:3-oxo-5-alpha-steroid 4-dehydrogenase 3
MDASLLCRIFFTLGAAVDVGGTLIPSFRTHIMNYGSRSSGTPRRSHDKAKTPKGFAQGIFEYVGSIQVPHTWFTHYYVISVLSSVFWGYQIYTRGFVIELLAAYSNPRTQSMTANQIILAWALMAAQGVRRLHESITLTKPSQSKMWVGIWALGIAYYLFMGISVWVEGIGT